MCLDGLPQSGGISNCHVGAAEHHTRREGQSSVGVNAAAALVIKRIAPARLGPQRMAASKLNLSGLHMARLALQAALEQVSRQQSMTFMKAKAVSQMQCLICQTERARLNRRHHRPTDAGSMSLLLADHTCAARGVWWDVQLHLAAQLVHIQIAPGAPDQIWH